jgi:hypothetical protein
MIKLFLAGEDASSAGTTDANMLALSGTANNSLNLASLDGVPGFFAGAAIHMMTPTTTPIVEIQETLPIQQTQPITQKTQPITQILQTAPITIDNGASGEINRASAQAVIFEGTNGTLRLDDASAFAGQVSGLTGADAIDLADISDGANTKATFSGNADGGTLTVTNGSQTANITLLGDYLTSGWTLSSDGHGGTLVVDPLPSRLS